MPQRFWLTAALLGLSALSAPMSHAGSVVEQSVKVSLGSGSHLSRHLWHISGDQFDLEVSTSSSAGEPSERKFIFNGRIMYICGKLDPKQLKAAFDLNVSDPAMLKKFETGVCQEVPSNFLVRFFMSPVAAIESIDLSDGLKLTLEIESFELEPTQTKKIAGQSTKGFSRNFTMRKTGDTGKTTQTIKESFFSGTSESVRRATWTELSKNLMRQPKGVQLLKHLKRDRDSVQGLIMESETIFESELPGGSKLVGTISATTTRFETADLSAHKFRIPPKYAIFSPENLQTIAKNSAPKSEPRAGKKQVDELNLLDKVQSVFFCAISGALGCYSR